MLTKNQELGSHQDELDQELSSLRLELDQSAIQAKALEADNKKKSRELEQVQEERNQLAGLKGELEEVCHEVESLRIDNKKKTQELEKTQYQRDEAVGTLRIVTKKEDVKPSEEDEEDEDG